MGWQDQTITLGELARLLREERSLDDEGFVAGLNYIALAVMSHSDMTDGEKLAFLEKAGLE